MTIDEAISHAMEVAERQEFLSTQNHGYCEEKRNVKARERCAECAADHRQLADWLVELKQWRKVYGVCPSYEMCIPECKEGYNAQIAEYKRLLKMAVDAIYELLDCGAACSGKFCDKYCIYNCETCPLNEENGTNGCGEWRKWKHADEALKLIGATNDEP